MYPIGWSRNGAVALIHSKEEEASGAGAIENLIIFDAVTDKVLYRTAYNANDWFDGKIPPLERAVQSYESIFKRFGIVPLRQTVGHGAVVDSTGVNFSIRNIVKGSWYGIEDMTLDYDLVAGKSGVSKKVATMHGKAILQAVVYGYLRSPYENRVLVLVAELKRGWEGPPHVIDLGIYGCHLDAEFGAP